MPSSDLQSVLSMQEFLMKENIAEKIRGGKNLTRSSSEISLKKLREHCN